MPSHGFCEMKFDKKSAQTHMDSSSRLRTSIGGAVITFGRTCRNFYIGSSVKRIPPGQAEVVVT